MKNNSDLIKNIKFLTYMPKRIKIGYNIQLDDNNEAIKYGYSRIYRNKEDWSSLVEIESEHNACNNAKLTIYLAYDKTMISLIKKNKRYKKQKIKVTNLDNESAHYIFNINSSSIELQSDTPVNVYEYYTRSRLDAVVIKLTFSNSLENEINSTIDLIREAFCVVNNTDIEIKDSTKKMIAG